ncbi:family 90 putative glycosyltransferase [Triangularia verruculosa]|uniref:Family 90 putative glycosyltransferase n=1 Tax=Triangularia verruculosa TaxID=2587418 RepID=A0AAN6XMV7_9PEZI|nr:family 90 putative glycosyltransferase [Triangularia verruculosa]
MSSQLAALCAVTSFLWLINSVEDHQIVEQPRLSSTLILLIASFTSYAISHFSAWLPGANGRFDDELGLSSTGNKTKPISQRNLPKKPRRYFVLILIICIILRLESFHRVTADLQCSKPGLEAFLPLLIIAYQLYASPRRARTFDDEREEFTQTMYEAFSDFVAKSLYVAVISTSLLSFGVYLALTSEPKSTLFCSSRNDWAKFVVFVQWTGVVLDAAIVIIAWRILAWARTTKSRLRTLAGILLVSGLGAGLLWVMSGDRMGGDPLFWFDCVIDGLTLATLLVSSSLLAPEGGNVLGLVGVVTFITGLLISLHKVFTLGSWENVSGWATWGAVVAISVGFSLFVYSTDVRRVAFIHRSLVVFLLLLLVIAVSIFTPIKMSKGMNAHPLSKIIYDARVESDRWLIHADYSDSLPAAVREYQERNHGRAPPKGFDKWWEFANEKKSPIMDHFKQMGDDILPFWGISPVKLREDTRRAAKEFDMALLKIQNGTAKHNLPQTNPYKAVMDELVELTKDFAEHLPDFEMAINLEERPRVLAPWDQIQRSAAAGMKRKKSSSLLPGGGSRDDESVEDDMPEPKLAENADKTDMLRNAMQPDALRELTALTCPTGTKVRSGVHWDIRDFCSSCAKPQSNGQFLTNQGLSLELCHQPDLMRLHSFHMAAVEVLPFTDLLPIFSRSKTDNYADIILPLKRPSELKEPFPPKSQPFEKNQKKLFYREKISRVFSPKELLRGGQQERLVHLTNLAPFSTQKHRMLLPNAKRDKAHYREVLTAPVNSLLPFDVAFSSYSPCDITLASCPHDFSSHSIKESTTTDPFKNQYILTLDTDTGPSPLFPSVLASPGNVPFLSTIFKEWYTERLRPWVHFVPVDIRFQALHSTLAYFVGLKDQTKEHGSTDGRWIANHGARWASEALRREDRQVYLFRLMLEWGRLVDDDGGRGGG